MSSALASGLLSGFFLVFMGVLMIPLKNSFFNLVRDLFFAKTETLYKSHLVLH